MLISVTSQEIKFVRVYTIVHPIVLCILMEYKLNDPEIKPCPSKHRRKNWIEGEVYDFSVSYQTIDVRNIEHIHKYLVKKHNIV